MRFYKVFKDDKFIGVGTSQHLRRYQKKHGIPLVCDENQVQYIQIGEVLYHDNWMIPETIKGLYDSATVIEIDEDEYNTLYSPEVDVESVVMYEEPEVVAEPVISLIDTMTIEQARNNVARNMETAMKNVLSNGVDVVLTYGESKNFSITPMFISSLIDPDQCICVDPNNEVCFYSLEDTKKIKESVENFVVYHHSYLDSIKRFINSLNTISELKSVEYGMKLRKKFQTPVYQVFKDKIK